MTLHGVKNPYVPEEEQQNGTRYYLTNYINLQQFYLIIVTNMITHHKQQILDCNNKDCKLLHLNYT